MKCQRLLIEIESVLMVAENYLFDPGVQKIISFLDQGLLGKVQAMEFEEIGDWNTPNSKYFPGYTWRLREEVSGGGDLLDCGVHLTGSAARLGGKVRAVTD